MLAVGALLILYKFFSKPFDWCCGKYYKGIQASQIEEELDNFYKAVDSEDRDWWVMEEEHCRKNLGFQILSD